MKLASASSTLYFDSAAISLARYPRENAATRSARLSRRALLQIEDRTGSVLEIVLRVILGSSLLVALCECATHLAH